MEDSSPGACLKEDQGKYEDRALLAHRLLRRASRKSRDPAATCLRVYGNNVFGALRRTRKARPVWHEKALARLDNWATEHGLPPEPFARMQQEVIALFADMERKSELD